MRSFTWGVDISSKEKTEHKVNVVQFGDGYRQVSKVGINNERKSWQCKVIGDKVHVDEVKAFLNWFITFSLEQEF